MLCYGSPRKQIRIFLKIIYQLAFQRCPLPDVQTGEYATSRGKGALDAVMVTDLKLGRLFGLLGYTHTHIHAYMHTYIHIHIHIYAFIHTYVKHKATKKL